MSSSRFAKLPSKILAVGRNFGKHAAELGNAVPKEPIIFSKPISSIIYEGEKIRLPPSVKEIHHEVELAVIMKEKCQRVSPSDAAKAIAGYAISLDLTDRALQNKLKKDGLPWTLCKGFDTSCPLGKFVSKDQIPDPHKVTLWMKVNGKEKQRGSTDDMIFRIPDLISYISQRITLEPGDIVLTGTPEGVGPLVSGDKVDMAIEGFPQSTFHVE